jgi:energy-coupling factor transporter ATP-binding protein EcfA2
MDWISARHDQAATGPMELIGREPEIQQLRLFVSRITQGAGEALLLSGDPGVGKTSLLDHAAAIAADSGIRLLRATGSQFEANISFGALHQLLRPCFAELPHLSPLLARALNVALCLGEGPPPAQLLVASAVLALLQQAAKEQPSPRNNARPPCSPRQATPTKRSPPASSSPREQSPPTSTRSSPNSASPPAPPSATHSPIRLPNETLGI